MQIIAQKLNLVLTFFIKYDLNIHNVVLITCKKCGDINYLNSEALGHLTDFGFKCRYCDTVNRVTFEDGKLKKHK